MTARNYCDAAISMDADLQDDVKAISKMVEKYLAGADIVYGVRSDRSTDTAFKRGTAHAFIRPCPAWAWRPSQTMRTSA